MNTNRDVTLHPTEKLYVIPEGSGVSCLGFEVAERWARQVADWLPADQKAIATALMDIAKPGELDHYKNYRAVMTMGNDYARRTGKRCEAQLTPALKGLEGQRVEITYPDGEKSRFYVGKSTGWLPIHLEIKTRASSGGGAVYFPEGATVRVVGGRR